jgi:hypothetical protein
VPPVNDANLSKYPCKLILSKEINENKFSFISLSAELI